MVVQYQNLVQMHLGACVLTMAWECVPHAQIVLCNEQLTRTMQQRSAHGSQSSHKQIATDAARAFWLALQPSASVAAGCLLLPTERKQQTRQPN